jgi:MFS family permease
MAGAAACRRFVPPHVPPYIPSPPRSVSVSSPATGSAESLLHQRSFVLFWFARVATMVAYQMMAVAVGWQVYDLTGSALDLGFVGLAQFLPSLALVLVVGHVADRYDRRRILEGCQHVQAVAATVLAAQSLTGTITERSIFSFIALIGAARAFQMPTQQALLPSLVSPQLFPRALASAASAGQAAVIAGPALGGLVYIAGPTFAYGTSAVLFVVAGVLVHLVRTVARPAAKETPTLHTLFAGIAFIRSRPALLGAISLDLFAVLLGGATALLPIYARDILDTGPWGLGLLRSSTAVGALAMAIYLSHRPLGRQAGRKMFAAVAVFGVGTIVFGLSRWLPLSAAALILLGAADMISVVVRQTLVQIGTPDSMRGRVSAVNSIFIGSSNQLGEFESGLTADFFGTVPSVVIGGIGTLLVVLAWMRLFPTLLDVDRIDTAPKTADPSVGKPPPR